MAGDILLTSRLAWPANSSLYHWVLDFLLTQAERPGAVAALREADEAGLGNVDLEELAVADRDELYEILRDRLVPDAAARIPEDAGYRDTYLAELGELARMAGTALERYRGQEIADHTIVLGPGRRWQANRAVYMRALSFLARSATGPAATTAKKARMNPGQEFDLTVLPADERDEVLALLQERLVEDSRRRIPEEKAGLDRLLGKLRELAEAARATRH